MDTLSKLSHDSDEEVALGAIFALGLIAAGIQLASFILTCSGTNNSRVANMLRGLATYYYKSPNHLFVVRLAQGLVFLGKGTITLAPMHADRMVMSRTAIAGLLTVMHACLDFKNSEYNGLSILICTVILGKSHYLLYCLVMAFYPRMLMTFDENLKPLPVSVRVGQAVDTIGQAGKPKTITGFQTHNTPVLLGYNDRAELATDECKTCRSCCCCSHLSPDIPVTNVLEGFVILRPNPDYKPEVEDPKKAKKQS